MFVLVSEAFCCYDAEMKGIQVLPGKTVGVMEASTIPEAQERLKLTNQAGVVFREATVYLQEDVVLMLKKDYAERRATGRTHTGYLLTAVSEILSASDL